MGKILALTGVTGGKSGGILVEQIASNLECVSSCFDDGIRVLMRETSREEKIKNLIPNVEIMRGDFRDMSYLKTALTDVDTLVHVAGIFASRNIVEAAAFNKVRRLVLVHTTGIYSKYKDAGEEYRKTESIVYETCKKHGIILTILRPTMIYGNLLDKNVITFIKMVDKLPIMPVVNGARYGLQPVHYKDLGLAYYQVLMNEQTTANKDFILSGGNPIELRDMLLEIGQNLGKTVRFISVPFPIAYAGAVMIYWLSIKRADFREKVQRLCEPRIFDYNEAKEAFGYEPMTFSQGIVDEVKEYLEKK